MIDPTDYALAHVLLAAARYREAAEELDRRRQDRHAALLAAKTVGATTHQIADAAGISDQRTSWILAAATRSLATPD